MPDLVGLWSTAVNLGLVMVMAVPLVFSWVAAWMTGTGSERWDIKDAGDCSELDARTT